MLRLSVGVDKIIKKVRGMGSGDIDLMSSVVLKQFIQ